MGWHNPINHNHNEQGHCCTEVSVHHWSTSGGALSLYAYAAAHTQWCAPLPCRPWWHQIFQQAPVGQCSGCAALTPQTTCTMLNSYASEAVCCRIPGIEQQCCCHSKHHNRPRDYLPLLTADALDTATAGPLLDTATALLLAALGPLPAAADSDLAMAGPPPRLMAADSDCASEGPFPLLARARSDAIATPPGPACSATEDDLAEAGPAPVTALAEPWAIAAMSDMALAVLWAMEGPTPALLSASLLAVAGPP